MSRGPRWEGAVVEEDEVAALFKTTQALAGEAARRLGALHPHDTPAILTINAAASPAFARWVQGAVTAL